MTDGKTDNKQPKTHAIKGKQLGRSQLSLFCALSLFLLNMCALERKMCLLLFFKRFKSLI